VLVDLTSFIPQDSKDPEGRILLYGKALLLIRTESLTGRVGQLDAAQALLQ
jgi:hypothetical protein